MAMESLDTSTPRILGEGGGLKSEASPSASGPLGTNSTVCTTRSIDDLEEEELQAAEAAPSTGAPLWSNDEPFQATEEASLPGGGAAAMEDFLWTSSPLPHSVRRRLIRREHPEVEELYGSDPLQAIPMVITVFLQLALAYQAAKADVSWWLLVPLCFLVSATLNHSLFAALHEACHRTVLAGKYASEFLCIAVTVPLALPAGIPFKRYHLEHHIFQGVEGVDPDLPTTLEAWFFKGTLRKAVWIFLLPFSYSLRPLFTRPKPLELMDSLNWLVVIVCDILIFKFWGIKALMYLILGTFFSMNFHPFAGHFLSEHFIFPSEGDVYQETHSYYGWCNLLTYNVGYHNEHHDFPRIPGSRLPMLKSIASEFYSMTSHDSWFGVTWEFILNDNVNGFNRVKRQHVKGGPIAPVHLPYKMHEGFIPKGGPGRFWPTVTPECVGRLKMD